MKPRTPPSLAQPPTLSPPTFPQSTQPLPQPIPLTSTSPQFTAGSPTQQLPDQPTLSSSSNSNNNNNNNVGAGTSPGTFRGNQLMPRRRPSTASRTRTLTGTGSIPVPAPLSRPQDAVASASPTTTIGSPLSYAQHSFHSQGGSWSRPSSGAPGQQLPPPPTISAPVIPQQQTQKQQQQQQQQDSTTSGTQEGGKSCEASGYGVQLPISVPPPKKSSIYGSWKAAQDVKIILEGQEGNNIMLPTFPNTKVNETIMAVKKH